jgi:tetratricopeptide (TPR) repeat protein
MKKTVWIITILLLAARVLAGEPTTDFIAGNEAFKNRHYREAISSYENLLNSGFVNAEIHYNLGCAYYRNGKLGKAILHFEKAALLAPSDKDIQHNLSICRKKVKGEMAEVSGFFIFNWFKNIRSGFGTNVFASIALVLCWMGFVGLAIWLFGKTRVQRKWAFIVGITLVGISLIPFFLAASRNAYQKSSEIAILTEKKTKVKSAPDSAGSEVIEIFEGTKLEIQDKLGDWTKVRLPDGETGWLPNNVFEKI